MSRNVCCLRSEPTRMKYSTLTCLKTHSRKPTQVRTWHPCYGLEIRTCLWFSDIPRHCSRCLCSALENTLLLLAFKLSLLHRCSQQALPQLNPNSSPPVPPRSKATTNGLFPHISESCCQALGVPHTHHVNCLHMLESPPPSLIVCLLKLWGKWGVKHQQFYSQVPLSTLIFNLWRPAVCYCMWHQVCFQNFEHNYTGVTNCIWNFRWISMHFVCLI